MPEGEIVPCCYNRSYLYGQYPKQSLNEVWFGESSLKFRERMMSKRFDSGCQKCLDQIEAKNFEGVHAKMFDFPLQEKINEAKDVNKTFLYPEILEFELSNTCNLECVMCSGTKAH